MLVPRPGYLADARATCDDASALLIADEIQSGLARPGELLALDHEGVRADLYILARRWAGGSCRSRLSSGGGQCSGCRSPASTDRLSGGNPLACAVGRAVIALLATGELQSRSQQLGAHLHARLHTLLNRGVAQITGRGLWAACTLRPVDRPDAAQRKR